MRAILTKFSLQGFIRRLSALLIMVLCAPSYGLLSDSHTSSEVPSVTPPSLADQRYHYELARSALDDKDNEAFSRNYALLGDYPLVPYLDYIQLKQTLQALPFSKIDLFLAAHKGAFLETRLREQVLHVLAGKKQWNDFLHYYNENTGSKDLYCHYLTAKASQDIKGAMTEISSHWAKGRSHPKACDSVFAKWINQGGIDDTVVWDRFVNAMGNRKTGLARYVKSHMSDKQADLADLMLRVHSNPSLLKRKRQFALQSKHMQQIIAHGTKRLARRSPKLALKLWESYEAQHLFPQKLNTETKLTLVKYLTRKGFTEEAEALIQASGDLRQKHVIEGQIRESLRQGRYAKAWSWIHYLDDDATKSDRWQYWQARINDILKLSSEPSFSRNIYLELAQQRGFYGFLSADKLDQPYSLKHKSANHDQSTLLTVESVPAMQRAKELWQRGSHGEAQAEWLFATKNMNSKELIAAGQLAQTWGWYNKGILAMITGDHWDYLDIRFPLAYSEAVNKVAQATNIDTTLIYAVARQESAFLETAKSPVGARGLMQLMPNTARSVAKKQGLPFSVSELYNPEYNLTLGSNYLNELLERFDGNRILAAAAYNAGPHRVDRWIKNNPQVLPFDVWIETIPFAETRGYVQNILAFSVIFSYQMGKSSELVTASEEKKHL